MFKLSQKYRASRIIPGRESMLDIRYFPAWSVQVTIWYFQMETPSAEPYERLNRYFYTVLKPVFK